MMHIASPDFYSNIEEDMGKLVGKDVVFFYEGVQVGSEESLEELSSLMGSNISPEMYDTLASMAELIPQTEDMFTNILPSVNVDLTTDDIVALAGEANVPTVSPLETTIIDTLADRYPTMNSAQKFVVKSYARALMNMILRVYENPVFMETLYHEMPIFQIILNERNQYVVDTLLASPTETIYIHYGAMHFPWILTDLQVVDPWWHEVDRTNFRVMY